MNIAVSFPVPARALTLDSDEDALVRAAQSGNLDAFNWLVLKYQERLFRTALNILDQDGPAEDAVQEAFISAYRHIHDFRGGSLKAWLMRIVINKCYEQQRRNRRYWFVSLFGEEEETDDDPDLGWQFRDPAMPVEECVEASQWMDFIRACLERLPVDFRAVLVLVDVEEFSYQEVSNILNLPVGTVKSRLARARARLRQELYQDHLLNE